MESKGLAILGAWISITAFGIFFGYTQGMEFLGVLILLVIGAIITFGVLGGEISRDSQAVEDTEKLNERLDALEKKIDELMRLLEE